VPAPAAALEETASPDVTRLSETATAPPQADTVGEEAAVLAEVARLNALAAKALARYRLLLPEDDNAYSYYRQVLALDPDNGEAYAGLSLIVQKYGEMAETALDKNDLVKAELYVERALSVDPGHSESLILRDRIERAIADVEAARQAEAQRGAAQSGAARQRGLEPSKPTAPSPSSLERLMRFVEGSGADADQ
jgi:tetratricopeptide (TPR) repeat protein